MSLELVRRLLSIEALGKEDAQKVLFVHVSTGKAVVRTLIELGLFSFDVLNAELEKIDSPVLRTIVPVPKLFEKLPENMCERLMAIPVRLDSLTGTIDVAAADPTDKHIAKEFSFQLSAPIRVVRAPLSSVEEALRRIKQGDWSRGSQPEIELSSVVRPRRQTPAYLSVVSERPMQTGIPQLRRPISDMPIPLVRRSTSKASPDDSAPKSEHMRIAPKAAPTTIAPPPMQPMHASRDPYSPEAPQAPLVDQEAVTEAIIQSKNRDDVIEQLVKGLSGVASKVAIFLLRRGEYSGFRCNEKMGDIEQLRQIVIPASSPSVLATAAITGYYLGPIPKTAAHNQLISFISSSQNEVSVTPVRVGGKLALMIVMDDLGDTLSATRLAEVWGQQTGQTLERLVQRER
jgi:hypothetical protein